MNHAPAAARRQPSPAAFMETVTIRQGVYFRPFDDANPRRYHPWLRALAQADASGVYVIRDNATAEKLYVGESHSGRLYDTITRHFRAWTVPSSDPSGRRQGGTTYDRRKVRVALWIMPPGDVRAEQYRRIAELAPRDNTQDCRTCEHGPGEEIPI